MTNQQGAPEALRQILLDPENQPNQYGVQFLMHGPKMAFKIEARQFTLDYEPTEPGEFEFMRDALIDAFSIFTPDVKLAQQPAAHVQNPAEIEHVAGDVSKNGPGSNMAQQPAPSAAAAVVVYEQKENEMQVWFRPARMHGHPERTPIKATITKDRGNGIVDLTYDDGEFSGNARAVPNALRLPRNVREQVAVWWDVGFEMDFQTAVDNSLKKKKDDPPPQPSPTPQADSQPAAVLDYPPLPRGWPARFRCDSCDGNGEVGEPISMGHFQPPECERCPDCDGRGWCSEEDAFSADHMRAYVDADRAARAPADSVTAPAGGMVDGWKLAPKEPTLHMGWAYLDAARESEPLRTHTFNHAGYRAMLAAAPTPPAQAADSVLEDAARLDFLAAAPEGCVRVDSIGGLCPSYIYWGTSDYYSNAGRNDSGSFIGPTPRAAIDAARKQGGKP